MIKKFKDLTEQEILALAISLEEEDGRVYGEFALALMGHYPATAEVFRKMQAEEADHHRYLLEAYRRQFGEHIPILTRHDVRGFVARRPVWLVLKLGLNAIRQQAEIMELETCRFYRRAASRCADASTRQLLTDLAEVEQKHTTQAMAFQQEQLPADARQQEDSAQRRLFLLQVVQPGLVGLMDGSISTLAPLFAVAFATRLDPDAFVAGLATSVGAGISMGFAEALSDDGELTGRGHPVTRGVICGLMTAGGGLGHTLPYLIPQFTTATAVAVVVVFLELIAISWIRVRFMDTPWWQSIRTVFIGGILVFFAGVVIGLLGHAAIGG